MLVLLLPQYVLCLRISWRAQPCHIRSQPAVKFQSLHRFWNRDCNRINYLPEQSWWAIWQMLYFILFYLKVKALKRCRTGEQMTTEETLKQLGLISLSEHFITLKAKPDTLHQQGNYMERNIMSSNWRFPQWTEFGGLGFFFAPDKDLTEDCMD